MRTCRNRIGFDGVSTTESTAGSDSADVGFADFYIIASDKELAGISNIDTAVSYRKGYDIILIGRKTRRTLESSYRQIRIYRFSHSDRTRITIIGLIGFNNHVGSIGNQPDAVRTSRNRAAIDGVSTGKSTTGSNFANHNFADLNIVASNEESAGISRLIAGILHRKSNSVVLIFRKTRRTLESSYREIALLISGYIQAQITGVIPERVQYVIVHQRVAIGLKRPENHQTIANRDSLIEVVGSLRQLVNTSCLIVGNRYCISWSSIDTR